MITAKEAREIGEDDNARELFIEKKLIENAIIEDAKKFHMHWRISKRTLLPGVIEWLERNGFHIVNDDFILKISW